MSGDAADWWPSDPPTPESTPTDRAALRSSGPSLARDPLAVPGLLAAVAGLALDLSAGVALGPPAGLAAAIAVVTLWAYASPLYAATAAALLSATVTPGGPGQAALAAGVGAMLLALVARSTPRWRALLATGFAGLTTGGIVAAGLLAGEAALTTSGLLAAVGLAGYAIHRYSLVRSVGDGP